MIHATVSILGRFQARDDAYQVLSRSLQVAAARGEWSPLAVAGGSRGAGAIIEQLRMARACGAILNTLDSELL